MIVFHVHGFSDDRGVREVCVTQSEAENVIAMARPTIERATSTDHTELVRLNRTWPIDGYGQEWAVSQVNAVTRTTLDDGATWHEDVALVRDRLESVAHRPSVSLVGSWTVSNFTVMFFPDQESWKVACKERAGYKRIYKNARVRAFIDPITKIRVELIGAPELTDSGFANDAVLYGSPLDTIKRFDFTITKFALYSEIAEVNGEPETLWMVVYHPEFFEHLQQKRLVIDDELVKPFSTFERALRYTGYGYRLCRESKVKLVTEMQGGLEDEAQISASFYDGMD